MSNLKAAIEAELERSNLLVDRILMVLLPEDASMTRVALSSKDERGRYEVSGEALGRILSDHGHPCSGDAIVKWRKRHNEGDE